MCTIENSLLVPHENYQPFYTPINENNKKNVLG